MLRLSSSTLASLVVIPIGSHKDGLKESLLKCGYARYGLHFVPVIEVG